MKKKLSKIIALLLTVASLLSMFTVFAWADENEEEGPEEEEIVVDFDVNEDWLYYRTYEDGWGPGNGVSSSNGELLDNITKAGHKVSIDYEVAANGDYNYFTRFEYNDPASAISSV